MNTKNLAISIVLIALIGAVVWFYIIPLMVCTSASGTWKFSERVCDMGTIDLGNIDETPEVPETPETPSDPVIAQYKDLIRVTSPLPQETVSSPITIKGEARGNWFFEASFPVTIVDWDGLIIGEGIAQADGEWMTTEYVPFTATISYTLPANTPYRRGSIILRKDNPSGLPEHDDAFEYQVNFK